MNREQLTQFLLSGTVTFPGTLPGVVELAVRPLHDRSASQSLGAHALIATQRPSPSVTMVRTVSLADVRAVFIPRDVSCIRFDDGAWYLGCEVAAGIQAHCAYSSKVLGIAYVPESCPSLLEVSTGLTAGESIQYYPPLPCDRSQNHYDASRRQGPSLRCPPTSETKAYQDECASFMWTPCENIDPYLSHPSAAKAARSMAFEANYFCDDCDYGTGPGL